jgi:hypothetical protein
VRRALRDRAAHLNDKAHQVVYSALMRT